MQYVLIEIESLEKANVLYMTDTEKDMRKTIKLMETLGNLVQLYCTVFRSQPWGQNSLTNRGGVRKVRRNVM